MLQFYSFGKIQFLRFFVHFNPPNLVTLIWIFNLLALFISCNLGAETSPSSFEKPSNFAHLHGFHPDEGSTIHLHFRTRLTSPLDLLRRHFHIIILQFPNATFPVEIHLHKNHDLVHPSILQERSSSTKHAIFHGVFHPGGSVSFTATLHDQDHGFSGHIIQGNHHFYLEPVTSSSNHSHFLDPDLKQRRFQRSWSNSRRSRSSGGVSLPHKIYPMANLHPHDNATRADVSHVPKDELEKAMKEMMESEDNNNSSSTSERSSGSSTTGKPTSDPNDPNDPEVEEIERAEMEEDSDSTPSIPTLANTYFESDNNGNGNKNNGPKSGHNKKGKSRSRAKSSSSKKTSSRSKIVEIAIFADPKLNKNWENSYPKDGKTKMRTFILNLVNNMNLLYQQPSLGVPISLRLVHLEILPSTSTLTPAGLDPAGGVATKYLKSFCKYAGKKNEKGSYWDHALLLTGHDLKEDDDKSIAGMAWFATMCLRYWSCSVSEGHSFATSYILTHELGHSLGMEHDGSGVSKGCDPNKFIMSPTGPGATAWSNCSVSNLQDFIAKGSPEVGKTDFAAVPTCLERSSRLKNQEIRYSSSSSGGNRGSGAGGVVGGGNKLPGEIYSLSIQCAYDCGQNCRPHINHSEEEVCVMLWCERDKAGSGGRGQGQGQGIEVMEAHPALEGSFCGSGKYCIHGKCVKTPSSSNS